MRDVVTMLVSKDELVTYMNNIGLSETQVASVDKILAGVQAELERRLNRSVERQTDITETLIPDYNGFVYPSKTPIYGVSSVVNAADNTPISAWYVAPDQNSIYTGIFSGLIVEATMYRVTVTYTGGYDMSGDEGVKLAIKRVAAREVQNRHDDTLSVKDLGEREVDAPLVIGWTDADLKPLSRLRKRVVA